MQRKSNLQTLSWFWDLYQRGLLDLDPPYQRRSVWNQHYKDLFVDTVLNNYPCPSIFVFERISPEGVSTVSVVDGKQRLLTLFQFAEGAFPVASATTVNNLADLYFNDLPNEVKQGFWRYQFSVEYVPEENQNLINDIFDRLNRNVARLTRQELRHARLAGDFISSVETLTEWMFGELPPNFPLIAKSSRRQMKDIEFVAQLLLLIESGPQSFSQEDLDIAFIDRDTEWPHKDEVIATFKDVIHKISGTVRSDKSGVLVKSRFRNQADFYSLVGAFHEVITAKNRLSNKTVAERLLGFLEIIDNDEMRSASQDAQTYYDAARSASNDLSPRKARIDVIKKVLLNQR